MKHDVKKYLLDVLISINSIDEYLGTERNFKAYQSNKLLRRGVERELEIIGEAMNSILKLNPTIEISDARRIVDTRNWVIHGYDTIDDVIIWGIVVNHLPNLKAEVSKILDS